MVKRCKVATVLGSISATSNTVEPEGWQMKQCEYLKYLKKKQKKTFKTFFMQIRIQPLQCGSET
jgi:hypothetical protein